MTRGPALVLILAACLMAGVERAAAQTSTSVPSEAQSRRSASRSSWVTGGYANLSGGVQGATPAFTGTTNATLYVEPYTFSTRYGTKAAAFLDGRAGIRAGRRFMIGLGFSLAHRTDSASTAAQLPHPFYFDRTRPVSGTASGLSREDLGVHLEFGWLVRFRARTELALFAGPSALKIREDLVTHLRFVDSYPFDSVVFTGVQTASAGKTAIGFNLGADLTQMVSPTVGLGVLVRYSRAKVALRTAEAQGTTASAEVVAGGIQVGAGIRFRF